MFFVGHYYTLPIRERSEGEMFYVNDLTILLTSARAFFT
jgi:hypothetical protein